MTCWPKHEGTGQLQCLISAAAAAELAGTGAAFAHWAALLCLLQARLQLEKTLHTPLPALPPLTLASKHCHTLTVHCDHM